MAFCSHCGNSLDPATKFCPVCGTPVAAEPVATPVPEQPVFTAPEPVQPVYTAPEPVQPVYTAPEPAQPVYTAPQAPVYTAPQAPVCPQQPNNYYAPTYEAPPLSTKDKVFGYVGMGLAIGGFVFAIFGLIYTLAFMEEPPASFFFSLYLGMFSFPLSIIGRVFSNKSRNAGNPSTVCSVGSRMGLAGLIISCVMVFFGLISLGMLA